MHNIAAEFFNFQVNGWVFLPAKGAYTVWLEYLQLHNSGFIVNTSYLILISQFQGANYWPTNDEK